MADRKERNMCFAHRGGSFQTAHFEGLHFQSAEGSYCREDGLWHTKIILHRNHGRRAANLPNIVEEYNELVDAKDMIRPVSLPQMPSVITCFKNTGPTATNHILRRIQLDSKTNPTYWRWEHKPTLSKTKAAGAPRVHKAKKADAPIRTGLEGLVRELNLNPNILDMQGAYTLVSQNYFADKQIALNGSGQFETEDRAFLLDQLSRYFSKELAFVSKPFNTPHTKKVRDTVEGTVAKLVAVSGGEDQPTAFIQDDQVQLQETELDPLPTTEPNATICLYFREILPQWLLKTQVENVEISAKDIVTALNGGGDGGTYRSTCIPSFLRPFINENLVKAIGTTATRPSRYIVNVKGMALRLNM